MIKAVPDGIQFHSSDWIYNTKIPLNTKDGRRSVNVMFLGSLSSLIGKQMHTLSSLDC